MKTTIQKWGNRLGVRIPSHIAKDLSLENGLSVEILEEETRIVILPKTTKKLKDIIALITNDNIHYDEFESWKETIAIRRDASFMKEIKDGLKSLKNKKPRLYSLEKL